MKILKFVIRLFYRRLDGVAIANETGAGMPWWMGVIWTATGQHEVGGLQENYVWVYCSVMPINLPVRWLRRLVLWVKFGVTPWAV